MKEIEQAIRDFGPMSFSRVRFPGEAKLVNGEWIPMPASTAWQFIVSIPFTSHRMTWQTQINLEDRY